MFTPLVTRGLRPLVFGLMVTLAACQQQEPAGHSAPDEPAMAPGDPAPDAVDAGTAAPDMAADTLPGMVQGMAPGMAPGVAPAEAVREPRPLQLEIPADILGEGAETGFPETPARLPDLFAGKKKAGASVSGELLFEEGEKVAPDTMSGAKITIQIPVEN